MSRGGGLSTPSRVLLCVQAAAHCITLMFSLMVMIPMSVHQEHFRGHCILFSTGVWREQDGQFQVRKSDNIFDNYGSVITAPPYRIVTCVYAYVKHMTQRHEVSDRVFEITVKYSFHFLLFFCNILQITFF